jgi:hypothetical protein
MDYETRRWTSTLAVHPTIHRLEKLPDSQLLGQSLARLPGRLDDGA